MSSFTKQFVSSKGFKFLADSQEQAEAMQDEYLNPQLAAASREKKRTMLIPKVESPDTLYARRAAEANACRGVGAVKHNTAGDVYAKRAAEAAAYR